VSAYSIQAVKWEHGWELHVEDVGVTQCRTLATAAQQARDFVATMLDIDADDAAVMDISKGARLPTHQRLNPPRPAAHGTSRDLACASTSERFPDNGTRRP